MPKKIKVLLIEDNAETAYIEREMLNKFKSIEFITTHTTSVKESLKIIGKKFFDVILLDLFLPNGEGLEVFNKIHSQCGDLPIVIVSGYEEHAIQAVKAGAQDYLIKPVEIKQLVTSIKYAIERKKLEEECHEDYKRLLSIFDSMDEMIYISDPKTYEIIYMNEAIKKTFGCSIGHKCFETFGGTEFPCLGCHNNEVFGDNFGRTFTYDIQAGKNHKWYKSTIRAIKWPDGRILRYTISLDITDHKKEEEKLSKFLEKKIEAFNIEIAKSGDHYKKQIHRLEQITLDMVTDGAT